MGDKRNKCNVMGGKHENDQLKPRRGWEDNIKTDLREIE
jgi:hypothetical protein